MAKIAINGLGRIGRAAFKILEATEGVEVAAVNDLVGAENLAYLLNHDTVYGRYDRNVTADGEALVVDGRRVPLHSRRDPGELPWGALGIDLVLECTGAFRHEEQLARHLSAGTRFVVLSAPASGPDAPPTVVHGVNSTLEGQQIVSCASCTTNCITPVMEVMDRRIGVERALMTTVHAYTATQQLVDGPSKDFRRGRAGAANMLPASTGAARATTKALPDLAGRFDGVAVRVPVPVGSLADITLVTTRATTPEEINEIFREEAATARYRDVLGISDEPLVSSDIVGDPRASVVDAATTAVVDGTLAKVMSWYDNEMGFTHQMVREALSVLGVS
jgi:glyceraldehyde 3-phosphate dehydrogenase